MVRPHSCRVIYYFDTPALGRRHQLFDRVKFFKKCTQDKRKFLNEVNNFYWDDPYLFKYCPDQIFQRCIPDNEVSSVLNFVILRHVGVISHQERQLQKSYKMDFTGPPCSRTHMYSAKPVKIIKIWALFQNIGSL